MENACNKPKTQSANNGEKTSDDQKDSPGYIHVNSDRKSCDELVEPLQPIHKGGQFLAEKVSLRSDLQGSNIPLECLDYGLNDSDEKSPRKHVESLESLHSEESFPAKAVESLESLHAHVESPGKPAEHLESLHSDLTSSAKPLEPLESPKQQPSNSLSMESGDTIDVWPNFERIKNIYQHFNHIKDRLEMKLRSYKASRFSISSFRNREAYGPSYGISSNIAKLAVIKERPTRLQGEYNYLQNEPDNLFRVKEMLLATGLKTFPMGPFENEIEGMIEICRDEIFIKNYSAMHFQTSTEYCKNEDSVGPDTLYFGNCRKPGSGEKAILLGRHATANCFSSFRQCGLYLLSACEDSRWKNTLCEDLAQLHSQFISHLVKVLFVSFSTFKFNECTKDGSLCFSSNEVSNTQLLNMEFEHFDHFKGGNHAFIIVNTLHLRDVLEFLEKFLTRAVFEEFAIGFE